MEDTLNGFVNQVTNFKYEIIIHDDASSDETLDIIYSYQKAYPELFKVIAQAVNQYSQNVDLPLLNCFDLIQGKYVAFCEGDDFWTDKNKLQTQTDFLDSNPDYGLVFTDFDVLYQVTGLKKKACFNNFPHRYPLATEFNKFLVARSYMAPCTWLMRREYIYRPKNQVLDATFCWLLDVLSVTKIHYIDRVTTTYRVLEESASHSKSYEKMLTRENDILAAQLRYAKEFNCGFDLIEDIRINHINKTAHLKISLGEKSEIRGWWLDFTKLNYRTKILLILSLLPLSNLLIKVIYRYKNLFKRV
ncbi:TPA: glycosyltransferase [Vibrio vulnificus]|nr:glycosyltransferase [Vibrio vulnificus]